jgi:type I restriction enzyme M protein
MTDASTSQLVAKLWSFCHVLRDDGLSYLDYTEQLTYLLFLKMADERARLGLPGPEIPAKYRWDRLAADDMTGEALEAHYRETLAALATKGGMLGLVFAKAQNRVQDPAKLRRLIVELIGRQDWTSLSSDVKGDAYEGLLAKNAEDVKGGAGQYFTPRPLIAAIVDCVRPRPRERICDPACGTGGFLLAAHEHLVREYGKRMDKEEKSHLRLDALRGVELVESVSRLCAMNLILHGIGPTNGKGEPPIRTDDALREEPKDHFEVVLTNPPFGKKSSVKVVNEEGEEDRVALTYNRPDFWTTTSNKQLNFVQHVRSLLVQNGRAGVVVPDNVLFEGGAGETIRRRLLAECEVHTLLRLPTGIFYAQGVKANVLFFDRKPGRKEPWTTRLWVYDLRTNEHFTLRQNPLTRKDLDEFVSNYLPGRPREERLATWDAAADGAKGAPVVVDGKPTSGRWRSYSYDELVARDKCSLDLFWLRDESLEDSANLPEPHVLAQEIADDLRAALEQIEEILEDVPRDAKGA